MARPPRPVAEPSSTRIGPQLICSPGPLLLQPGSRRNFVQFARPGPDCQPFRRKIVQSGNFYAPNCPARLVEPSLSPNLGFVCALCKSFARFRPRRAVAYQKPHLQGDFRAVCQANPRARASTGAPLGLLPRPRAFAPRGASKPTKFAHTNLIYSEVWDRQSAFFRMKKIPTTGTGQTILLLKYEEDSRCS